MTFSTSSDIWQHSVAEESPPIRLDRLCRERWQLPQSTVAQWCRKRRIRCNGRPTTIDQRLHPGDLVTLFPPRDFAAEAPESSEVPTPPASLARALTEAVIFEDDDILVLSKPAGLATQDGGTVRHSVDRYLAWLRPCLTLRLVHRLDQATSGLLVIAKHRASAIAWAEAFRNRSVRKTYLAILSGEVPPGELRWTMDLPTKDGSLQEAVTVVHRVGFVASKEGAMSVVRCHPLTGRMHQIRRHASMAGHAIIGDAVYGDASSAKTMALHAWKIGWEGAPGGAFSLVCPLPLRWHELWPQADLLPFCHESSGRWKT